LVSDIPARDRNIKNILLWYENERKCNKEDIANVHIGRQLIVFCKKIQVEIRRGKKFYIMFPLKD
jgi:hypothetical protein